MNLLDLIREKKFLGQEFLTWVWFTSEVNSGLIDLKGYGSIEVWFEDRLALETGSGDFKQMVTCQGKDLDLAEARTALREGKKVSQARLRLNSEGREWRLTLKAEGLEPAAVRAPKTLDPAEEDPEDPAGRFLDRVAVMRELTRILDLLFHRFLKVRLGPTWADEELPRMRRWLREFEG